MIEITQADRDAAASGYFAWCGGNPVIPDRMKAGNADDHSMVQAFARHRTEERAAIVAWLRKVANINPQEPAAKAFVLLLCKAIEGGEYIK